MSVKHIFFDVGGVLIDLAPLQETLEEHFTKELLDEKSERLKALIQSASLGKRSLSEALKKFAVENAVNLSAEELLEMSSLSFQRSVQANQELLDYLPLLAKKTNIGVISNTVFEHSEFLAELGIYEPFHPILLSCEQGAIKPEESIFQQALDLTGHAAEELVFIDDSRDYLEGASKLGFHTIHYQDFKQLKKEIESLL